MEPVDLLADTAIESVVRSLPRLAQLALGARAGRIAYLVLVDDWRRPDIHDAALSLLARCEQSAARGLNENSATICLCDEVPFGIVADGLNRAPRAASHHSLQAIRGAYGAMLIAAHAAAGASTVHGVSDDVAHAIRCARDAWRTGLISERVLPVLKIDQRPRPNSGRALDGLSSDMRKISRAAAEQRWDDQTCVAATFFG